MGAEIAEVRAADGEEAALGVERQLGFGDQIAGLIVAEQRFVPLDDPFHRPAEFARRPGHQRELGIDHAAGAEIAADVAHQHAHVLGWHAENGGEVVLEPHRAAIAGIDGVAPGLRIVSRKRGARLHRHAGDARDPGVEPGDMRGAGEGGCGRFGVADLGIEGDV